MERAVFVPDLDRLPPPDEPYDRLYLGSEFCPWRLPGEREIREGHAAAARQGMAFSLVTPFLDEPGLARTLDLVQALPQDPSTEVVANDLGLIEALRHAGYKGTVVAGRLITRQRRGPGFQSFGAPPLEAGAALRGSALDSPAFIGFLGSQYGVRRFELDGLVQGVAVPALPEGTRLSLYRPWLLVTATRNCPWVFDGRTWERGRGCARPCRGRALRLTLCNGARISSTSFPPGSGAELSGSIGRAEGWRGAGDPHRTDRREYGGGARRQDPEACTCIGQARRPTLILGGCAQFLENRNDAPPPAGVDRIVWQPEVPS